DQLVAALPLVTHRQLDGVAGVANVDEVRALHDAALVHVQARDHALEQHQSASTSTAAATSKRRSYRALPEMTPARLTSLRERCAAWSSREVLPPELRKRTRI